MIPTLRQVTLSCVILTCAPSAADAGACGYAVKRFEASAHASRAYPNAGPSARQSVAAQLDRQPTPASVRRARQKAQAAFRTILARAIALDAAGRQAECRQALADARLVFELQ